MLNVIHLFGRRPLHRPTAKPAVSTTAVGLARINADQRRRVSPGGA